MLKKIIYAFFLCCAFNSTPVISFSQYTSPSGKVVTLDLCKEQDLKQCEDIFIRSFGKAYEHLRPDQLGVENVNLFLKEAIADVYDDFRLGQQKLVVAKIDGEIVGFAGFKPAEEPNSIYITQLSIDPTYWNQGIGRKLVFSVFDIYKDTQKLVVIARKVNVVAQKFYKKLGFVPSTYMHPGYNPERYIGYEWVKTNKG